jgi:ankyrin repeat protein
MSDPFQYFFKPANDAWTAATKEYNKNFHDSADKKHSLTNTAIGGVIGLGLGAGAIALAPVMGVPVAGALGIGAICLATTAIGAGIGVGINFIPSQEAENSPNTNSGTADKPDDPTKAEESRKGSFHDYVQQATNGVNAVFKNVEDLFTSGGNLDTSKKDPKTGDLSQGVLPAVRKGTRSSISNPPVSNPNTKEEVKDLLPQPPQTPAPKPSVTPEVTDAIKKEEFKAQLEKHLNILPDIYAATADTAGTAGSAGSVVPVDDYFPALYSYKLAMALAILNNPATADDKKITKLSELMAIGSENADKISLFSKSQSKSKEELNNKFVDAFSEIGVYPKINDIPQIPFAISLRIGSQAILENSESQDADKISALNAFLKHFNNIAKNNTTDKAEALDSKILGGNPDYEGLASTFLNKAQDQRKDIEFVQKEIDKGSFNTSHQDGYTILMVAAIYGQADQVNAIIAGGGDANLANNNGHTALMFAANHGHADVAQILIAGGGDANLVDNNGRTALMFATSNGHDEVAKILNDNIDSRREATNTTVHASETAQTSGDKLTSTPNTQHASGDSPTLKQGVSDASKLPQVAAPLADAGTLNSPEAETEPHATTNTTPAKGDTSITHSSSPATARVDEVALGVAQVEHPLEPDSTPFTSPSLNAFSSPPQVAAGAASQTPQQAAAGGGTPITTSKIPPITEVKTATPSGSVRATNTAAASSERTTSVEAGRSGTVH